MLPWAVAPCATIERLQVGQSFTLLKDDWNGSHEFKFGWEYVDTSARRLQRSLERRRVLRGLFLDPNAADVMENLFNRFGFEQSAARFFNLSANPDGRPASSTSPMKTSRLLRSGQVGDQSTNVTLDLGLRYDRASLFGDDDDNFSPRFGHRLGHRRSSPHHRQGQRRSLLRPQRAHRRSGRCPEKGGIFTRNAFDVALPRLGAEYTDSLIDLVITSRLPDRRRGAHAGREPRVSCRLPMRCATTRWRSTASSVSTVQ